jgi:hypothetical protein
MPTYRPLATALLGTALLTATAACTGGSHDTASATAHPGPLATGVAGMDADDIVGLARGVSLGLRYVRVTGTATDSGVKLGLDISIGPNEECHGALTYPSGLGAVEIRHTKAGTWLRPDAAYWRHAAAAAGRSDRGDAVAALLNGKFLTSSQDDPQLKAVLQVCGAGYEVSQMTEKPATYTKGSTGTVNGTPTVSVDGLATDGSRFTLHVATQGKAYILRLETSGDGSEQLDLSDFDKPTTVEVPPADQVVDTSQFQQKLNSA